MESNRIDGDWRLAESKPHSLSTILAEARKNKQIDLLEGQEDPQTKKKPVLEKGNLPFIVVATSPTEMIVSNGEWTYAQIPGTSLEYVSNTTGHVFHHKTDNKIYVLIGGRWFRASNRQGPWEFVAGGSLPSDFKNIPDDSPKENVKASVPDTPQAQEAVIANMIPQTAVVNRANAKMTPPIFDGEPKLEPLTGTNLKYVVNSPTPIIEFDSVHYYAVENGVWFTGPSVKGPWSLADSVPAAIYTIPPEAPLHYVTYVLIYRSTQSTVTIGYTPGYLGSVITTGSGAVVVYGTGFYYPPWIGTVWYGPPVTYGFGTSITYTPWTGWTFAFGFGWSWGAATVTVGWGWGCYPWWGPVGWGWYYPPPVAVAWGPRGAAAWGPWGGWAATTGNVYGRWGNTSFVTRQSGGFDPWTGNRWASNVGMSYNSRTGTLAAGQRAGVANVYTGNYAYGSRGAATNARTGITVSGGRATVGNVVTGNQATISHGRVTNERTGNTVRAGSIRDDQGSIGHIGDNVFATHDGDIYRHTGDGWQQLNHQQRRWNYSQPSEMTRSLDRERQFRDFGATRSRSLGSFRGGGFRGFRR